MKNNKIATIVDKMGRIKAHIAELQQEHDQLREVLVESGLDAVEGKLFKASISHSVVTVVDYRGLVDKLQPSRQMLAAHTREVERVQVRLTSRNGR